MKKILGLFTILFMMIVTLASCGSKVPSEVVGKYNLTEISGIPGILAHMSTITLILNQMASTILKIRFMEQLQAKREPSKLMMK